mmetsp:Transcript_2238/g.6341  ORF Transcript_2238/g.6341 Transcript_2238/m.6341 type:complete len:126 (+) Transcript_2238:117-494(+)
MRVGRDGETRQTRDGVGEIQIVLVLSRFNRGGRWAAGLGGWVSLSRLTPQTLLFVGGSRRSSLKVARLLNLLHSKVDSLPSAIRSDEEVVELFDQSARDARRRVLALQKGKTSTHLILLDNVPQA